MNRRELRLNDSAVSLQFYWMGSPRLQKTLKLARCDATLSTDVCNLRTNADLTLILRLGFRQINPAGGAASGTYNDFGDPARKARKIIKWDSGSWAAWKQNFCRSAERFWHGKFWLLNNLGVFPYKVPQGSIFLPNFYCRFTLQGSDANAGHHHHVIDVVRLDPSETWFGSHSTLYDNLDTNPIQKGTDSAGKPIVQQAHVHEVGHLMGLGHVDIGKAHCPATADTNAPSCYGVTDQDKNSVMGQGMQLRGIHATPWFDALKEFIKVESPSTLYKPEAKFVKRISPSLRLEYPRTVAEFEAGTHLHTLTAGR